MSPPAFLPGVRGASPSAHLLQITPRIAGQNLIPGVLFLKRAEGTLVRAYSALWVCGPGAGPGLLPRAPQSSPLISPSSFSSSTALCPISRFISLSCLYFHSLSLLHLPVALSSCSFIHFSLPSSIPNPEAPLPQSLTEGLSDCWCALHTQDMHRAVCQNPREVGDLPGEAHHRTHRTRGAEREGTGAGSHRKPGSCPDSHIPKGRGARPTQGRSRTPPSRPGPDQTTLPAQLPLTPFSLLPTPGKFPPSPP